MKFFFVSILSIILTLLISQSRWANSIDLYFYDALLKNVSA
jgi:hypothetical protein